MIWKIRPLPKVSPPLLCISNGQVCRRYPLFLKWAPGLLSILYSNGPSYLGQCMLRDWEPATYTLLVHVRKRSQLSLSLPIVVKEPGSMVILWLWIMKVPGPIRTLHILNAEMVMVMCMQVFSGTRNTQIISLNNALFWDWLFDYTLILPSLTLKKNSGPPFGPLKKKWFPL